MIPSRFSKKGGLINGFGPLSNPGEKPSENGFMALKKTMRFGMILLDTPNHHTGFAIYEHDNNYHHCEAAKKAMLSSPIKKGPERTPDAPCRVYLPTFHPKFFVNVGKYSIHGACGYSNPCETLTHR